MSRKLRNIAIIAHVDHGKTTMVDAIFKQCGLFREGQNQDVRAMDSNELEKERGITILSKCTSVTWKGETINILDTPGHSDFGAEVERIVEMVDGVLLVVDIVEKVMPQTKFVTRKALEKKKNLIILINKVDRAKASTFEELQDIANEAVNDIMDLVFDIYPEAINSPVFFGSGRDGYVSTNLRDVFDRKVSNIHELLDTILDYIPAPQTSGDKLQMLISMTDIDEYFGKLLIGKVFGGEVKTGQNVISLTQEKTKREDFRINKMFEFRGVGKVPIEQAKAGDIVCIAGGESSLVSDMISTDADTEVLKAPLIDPPTLSVVISANTSPLAGKEGTHVTIRKIKDRLFREAATNVGILIEEQGDAVLVKGRGELQLSVLMEQMRREGFEFMVGAPKILIKEEKGVKYEPQEKVFIDVPQEYASMVINKMGTRGAELIDMSDYADRNKLIFKIPARLLLGYFSIFMSDTKGTGILNKEFDGYILYKADEDKKFHGRLVATEAGTSTVYAMDALQDRGEFFIRPSTIVYPGMIVGIHNRDNDLYINVVKAKKLTNVRASGKDDLIKLPPPIEMTLEKAITFIIGDEKVEVTPLRICMCMKIK